MLHLFQKQIVAHRCKVIIIICTLFRHTQFFRAIIRMDPSPLSLSLAYLVEKLVLNYIWHLSEKTGLNLFWKPDF